ncbi:hypothetical protein CDIK_3150 [Cucumispora dikerogammari]|nr:hypothetical protein CDIK_3150 [Cucumispora dikerogammari]
MANKTEALYLKVLSKIADLTTIKPNMVLLDFERALINAVSKIYLEAEVNLCFFHFSQAIWRKIQQHGLCTIYKTGSENSFDLKRLLALSFLREGDIQNEYIKIKHRLSLNEIPNKEDLFNYLESTYIGIEHNNPLYHPKQWSVHDRVIKNTPRTTNGAEAFHRVLNEIISVSKPNIALFIQKILETEEMMKMEINQSLSGKLTFPNKNFDKEIKLAILIKHYDLFKREIFLDVVLKIHKFEFD